MNVTPHVARIPAAAALRLMGERPGTAAMPSVSVSANASREAFGWIEMDIWESDLLDLVEQAHLSFQGRSDGEIAGALKGFLDVRYGTRDGSACAEFSWEGQPK